MRWKTKEIVKLLESKDWKIEVNEPGGDVDTSNLFIDVKGGDALYVAGFNVEGEDAFETAATPDDVEVEMVEITDGLDSRGGLNSDSEKTGVAYGVICSRLRKAGFQVVPCMKDYF